MMKRQSRFLPPPVLRSSLLVLAALVALSALTQAAPFNRRPTPSRAPSLGYPFARGSALQPSAPVLNRPFVGTQPPALDLRLDLPPELRRSGSVSALASGPFSVPVQFFNMTTFPRPPSIGGSTPSQDIQPFWSPDEASILFASNRANLDGSAVAGPFHIWRSSADGSALVQLTGNSTQIPSEATGDQQYPALNVTQNRLAYSHRNASTDPFQLFVLDLSTGQRVQLTGGGTGLGSQLRNAIHPTWSTGGDRIAFAAQGPGLNVFNIYIVEVSTGNVTQITNGTNTNGIDSQDPAYSPSGQLIAFASTGKTLAADGSFATGGGDYDLWYTLPAPPGSGRAFIRVTGPNNSDEREPAWSPKSAGGDRSTAGRNLLAFASNRAGTYDIWWIFGLTDTDQPSPESASNPAKLIFTQDVNPDGSPKSRSDERYPTWAKFINSSNLAYQSNVTGNQDIWQADLLDITAPSVEPVDDQTVQNLRVTPRVTFPGDTVRIEARVRDLQSGVNSVWVQIKDPDSIFQGARDGEHKLFRARTAAISDSDSITVFDETDVEGVSVMPGSPNYRYTDFPQLKPSTTAPVRADLPAPTYTARTDDRTAFTGSANPPFDGRDANHPAHWLRLYDDGPAPAGHEPAGSVAGDNIYSNTWQTPVVGSDFLVDLIVYDNAFDPLNRVSTTQNWKIYDNVWGFSTYIFTGTSPFLAVMDYGTGQKFLGGRVGGGGGRFGPVSQFTDFGTESFILDVDTKFLPKLMPTDQNPIRGALNNLGPTSTEGDLYDLWRIQCRGPLDPAVLANYLPAIDKQPDPANPSQTRDVPVATHAVLWSAPFLGDLWTGRGTLMDADTQALLTNFVNAGGRLLVNGRDVAWALTQNGQVPDQPFFKNILKAQFIRDIPQPAWFPPTAANPNNFQLSAIGASPLVTGGIDEFRDTSTDANIDPEPLNLSGQRGADSYNPLGSPDEIQPLAGATAVFNYDADNVAGHIFWTDPATTAHVVFTSFGLEQVGRFYENNNGIFSRNYRGKLTHAALCWMTDFTLTGRVTDTSLRPVAGALVTATLQSTPTFKRTAITNADGSYIIRGLQPAFPVGNSYDVSAQAPGFLFQHASGANAHGTRSTTTNLTMTAAAAGSISGRVADKNGAGISGVAVKATLKAPPGFTGQTDFSAQTGADGTYRIGQVIAGDYTVQISPVPAGFTGPDPASVDITVGSGESKTNVNFALTPSSTGGGGGGGGGTPGNPTLPAGVNIIALPGDYSDVDIATLLGISADQIRLVAFAPSENRYVFFPTSPADRFHLGQAYFIRLQNPVTLTATRPVPTTAVSVNLNAGWNLVGHVGTVAVPLSQVKVQVAGQPAITFDQAVTQGLLRSTVYKFSGTSYSTTTQLEPFRGVWIRATQALTLIIPPAPAASGTSVRTPSVSPVNGSSRRPNLGFVRRTPQPINGTDPPPAPPRF